MSRLLLPLIKAILQSVDFASFTSILLSYTESAEDCNLFFVVIIDGICMVVRKRFNQSRHIRSLHNSWKNTKMLTRFVFTFVYRILLLTSKRSSIKNTIQHGIALWVVTLDHMWRTRPVTSYTSIWGKWPYCCSRAVRRNRFKCKLIEPRIQHKQN